MQISVTTARRVLCALALLAACQLITSDTSAVYGAEVIVVDNRTDLVQALQYVRPGTTISIAPGTYRGGLSFGNLQGTPAAPILLTAADPARPPVFRGGSTCLQLSDPSHVELRHLVFCNATTNGLNIDDGGSYDSPAHHVKLQHIVVRDIGPRGNRDGIKLSGLNQFEIDTCTVERWGEAGSAIDMVGCHQGTIVGCTFRYRNDVAANGVQTKGGSADVVIQRCHFEHAGSRAVNIGGSTGLPYFRPSAQGYEAQNITVQDNTFVGSMSPVAFVGVDGAVVQYNTFYRPSRWVLRILQETREESFVPCRNGRFVHNLIVFRAAEISTIVNVGPGTAPETFQFSNNHWYCVDRPERSNRLSLPTTERAGSYGTDPQLRAPEQGDLTLRPASPVRDAGVRVRMRG